MKKILLLLTVASLLPINIISASTYSSGIGSLEFNGKCKDNRPRSQDDHFRAIEKAKLAAWQKYVTKFSAEKRNNYETNKGAFTSKIDKYITEYVILETDCSKSRRMYTVAIKATIDASGVNNDLNALSADQGASSLLQGKRVAYYIVARKVAGAKSFDARVTKQAEKVNMIDSDETAYSDDTTTSFSGQTTERVKVTTGGSTVRKSEQRQYQLSDNQVGVDNAIANSLKRIQTRPMKGSSIDSRTGNDGLFDTVRQEFIGNGANGDANISDDSFLSIVQGFDHPALSRNGVPIVEHFLLGTMDAGPPRTDPDTGLTAVDVYVNAQLVMVDMGFEEVLAFVGPIARTGMGADERLAENQALKLAADVAVDELINKL